MNAPASSPETTRLGPEPAGRAAPPVARAVALLLCVGLFVYANSFTKAFLLDDNVWINGSPNIDDLGLYLKSMLSRVVVALTLELNYWMGEVTVIGYHVVNLAIHLGAALALFGIVRRTLLLPRWAGRFRESATGLALAAALLWTVHPLQTQAVTYIIQRCESLMGLFFLLTLYCVVRGAGPPARRGWFLAAVLFSALGMATKEVMVVVPLVVLAYDWVFLADSFGDLVRRRWGLYLGLAATWSVLALLLRLGNISKDSAGFGYHGTWPLEYFLTEPGVILHYLGLTVWPIPLCFDYQDWPVVHSLPDALVPGLILTLLFLGSLWALYRRSWLGFLGIWFFLILAPTSSFMPIADVAFEHRMYLPLAAPVVLIVVAGAAGLRRLGERFSWSPRLRAGVAVGLVAGAAALLGVRTLVRNEDYRSGAAMWSSVIERRPNNARGHTNLSFYLLGEQRTEAAIRHMRTAIRLDKRQEVAHLNLAYALWKKDRTDEALRHIHTALDLDSGSSLAHDVLGTMLLAQGKKGEAVAELRRAVKLDPRVGEYRFDLGVALAEQGHAKEARAEYDVGLRLDPGLPGRFRRRAWDNLLREPAPTTNVVWEALFHAEAACQATGNNDPRMLDTLAAARAAAGQFPPAVELARKARARSRAAGQLDLCREIEKRLRLYQLGKPFRREYLSLAAGEAPRR